MATSASGRSMEKFATLETTRVRSSPERNASKSRCRSFTDVSPLMTGASRASASSSSCSMYCPITSVGCPACRAISDFTTSTLRCVQEARR